MLSTYLQHGRTLPQCDLETISLKPEREEARVLVRALMDSSLKCMGDG